MKCNMKTKPQENKNQLVSGKHILKLLSSVYCLHIFILPFLLLKNKQNKKKKREEKSICA